MIELINSNMQIKITDMETLKGEEWFEDNEATYSFEDDVVQVKWHDLVNVEKSISNNDERCLELWELLSMKRQTLQSR